MTDGVQFGLAFVAATALALGNPAGGATIASRPNVVLVLTDDQGWGDLSCHGNPVLRTPNLDALHRSGVRLTNFHVDPVCAPTRAALMSGRYPIRGGVTETTGGVSLLRNDGPTMANFFAAAGYGTAMFGKWHLGDNPPCRPEDRGFEEVVRLGGGGITQTPDAWGNDYFDDRYMHNGRLEEYQGYCTDVFFDLAMEYIRSREGAPFFVYLATNAPHAPYNVADRYSRPFREKGVPPMVANFYGMIANLDENMGRLMRFLEEERLAENTVLLFMGDNGSAAGCGPRARAAGWEGWEGGRRGSKGTPYEGGHAVPCFIRWPSGGWVGGRDVDALCAHYDLLPTFIDAFGLPAIEHAPFDGISLEPLLAGRNSKGPERTLFISLGERRVVMTDEWRLVKGSNKQAWELFAIRRDPHQDENLAAVQPSMVTELAEKWDAWYAQARKGADERVAISLGDEREPVAILTAHDWEQDPPSPATGSIVPKGAQPPKAASLPWNQFEVRRMPQVNGAWTVEVTKTGLYEITLRSAPAEVNIPLPATEARLQLGDLDMTKEIEPEWVGDFAHNFHNGASSVTFQARLPAGRAQLRTFLIDVDGRTRGAFYVTVRRLGP